jgi:hypothetical protein
MRGRAYLNDSDDLMEFEPIRRNGAPVNAGHDFQRRTENAKNRHERLERRRMKEEEV